MKKKGVFLVVGAILVFVLVIYIASFSRPKEESNIETNNAVLLTAPPITTIDGEETKEPKVTKLPKKEEVGEEKENLSTRIEIADIPEEAWKILNISEERLSGELKIYTNSVGYATTDTVHYAGEMEINHMENTVTVGFYIKSDGLYQFNLIYDRGNKTYRFEQW